jgi:hypothetical protein
VRALQHGSALKESPETSARQDITSHCAPGPIAYAAEVISNSEDLYFEQQKGVFVCVS